MSYILSEIHWVIINTSPERIIPENLYTSLLHFLSQWIMPPSSVIRDLNSTLHSRLYLIPQIQLFIKFYPFYHLSFHPVLLFLSPLRSSPKSLRPRWLLKPANSHTLHQAFWVLYLYPKYKSAPPPIISSLYCQVYIYMMLSSRLYSSVPLGFCRIHFILSWARIPGPSLTTYHSSLCITYFSPYRAICCSLKVKCSLISLCFYTGYILHLECLFQTLENFYTFLQSQIKCYLWRLFLPPTSKKRLVKQIIMVQCVSFPLD